MSELHTNRDIARAAGCKIFLGNVCNKSHDGRRYVSTGSCVQCHALRGVEGRRTSKEAQRKYSLDHYYRHRERKLTRLRLDNKERPEIYAARRKKNYERHRDKLLAEGKIRKQQFRRTEVDISIVREAAWAADRKARQHNVPNSLTADALFWLRELQGYCCAYCGSQLNPHLDHKVPFSRGGTNEIHNVQWLCADHNHSKHTKTDSEYRAEKSIPSMTVWDASYNLLMRAYALAAD